LDAVNVVVSSCCAGGASAIGGAGIAPTCGIHWPSIVRGSCRHRSLRSTNDGRACVSTKTLVALCFLPAHLT